MTTSVTAPIPADRLMFWHPIRDEPVTEYYFVWGPVARSSSADREFRLRNVSYLYQAQQIAVTLYEFGAPARSIAAQHLLSTDGFAFTAAIDVGDLPPRATTGRLVLRRVTAPDADLGDGDIQLLAAAEEWV
jgi:hypothetical protein